MKLKSDRFGFEPEITAKIAKRRNPACLCRFRSVIPAELTKKAKRSV